MVLAESRPPGQGVKLGKACANLSQARAVTEMRKHMLHPFKRHLGGSSETATKGVKGGRRQGSKWYRANGFCRETQAQSV